MPAWPSRRRTPRATGSTSPTRSAGWRSASPASSRCVAPGRRAPPSARRICGRSRPCPTWPRALVFGLVAVSMQVGSVDQQVLVAGAIVVTILVSLRQYVTSQQNTRLLAQRLRSEERFQEILRNASDVVVVIDRSGLITYATPSTPALVAGEPASLVGSAITRLVQSEDAPLLRELLRTAKERAGTGVTIACRSSSTPPRDLEVGIVDLLANDLVGGIVVTFRDVTERLAFEAELRSRALHDPLTGLANRVLFSDRLEQALRRARRRRTRPAAAVPRPGHVQGRQRHARAHGRRRGPRRGGPTSAHGAPAGGHRRAARRGRVRHPHRGHPRCDRRRRHRGTHPRRAGRAVHGGQPGPPYLGLASASSAARRARTMG